MALMLSVFSDQINLLCSGNRTNREILVQNTTRQGRHMELMAQLWIHALSDLTTIRNLTPGATIRI